MVLSLHAANFIYFLRCAAAAVCRVWGREEGLGLFVSVCECVHAAAHHLA